MIYLAYFILIFTAIQLFIACVNALFKINLKQFTADNNPLISILIPARNEAKNIANIIVDITNQSYSNYELLIYDDESTDETASIVEQHVRDNPKIKIITSKSLPADWLGKNHACYCLSQQASGQYFLFLDADVRISNNIIQNVLGYAQSKELSFVSIFPKQTLISFGEKITVPIMNYILLTLLPLVLVYKSKQASLAAANGQFMLFNAQTYKSINPHFIMRKSKVEDIKIARYYKQEGKTIACLIGNDDITCRMYTHFNEAVNGFSKNALDFFGGNAFVAIVFWFVTTLGFLFISLQFSILFIVIYFAMYLVTRIIVTAISKQNIIENILLIPLQQISFFLFLGKAFVPFFNKKQQW